MSEITTVGLDLAKRVVSLCGEDAVGRVVMQRTLRRLGRTFAAEEFETEDAAYDERDASDACEGERLAEEHDTEYSGPDSANPSPNSVGSSDGQLPQR
jgi:hypothetical protein